MLRHAHYSLLSLLLLLVSAVPASVKGRTLSPSQAFSMASSSSVLRMPSGTRPVMPLALTLVDSVAGVPAVYVFGSCSEPGFLIAAADDAVGEVLLGYSDSGMFDAGCMPAPMQWLLDRYVFAVGQCAASAGYMSEQVQCEPVAPILSSKWSQNSPFNAMCPEIDGSRTPAGCVAAAVAQVMNVYQWPPFATGSAEYEFTAVTSAGEKSFKVSMDFSSHFYDWTSMQDVYGASSTAEQCDAVALLMADCGYAAQTAYSHDGSGASVLFAGAGMVDNFSYDPAMRYLRREWCTYGQWSDIIHDELSHGHPVIYSGYGSIDGHTFVIDGCDADGYFHFNWGWEGTADGYYTLADITPSDDSSDFQSYNAGQNMLVGVQPYVSGNPPGHMAVVDVFATNKSSYRSLDDNVNFLGGFYSFALTDLDYKIGFMADVDPPVYVPSVTTHLQAGWGINQASASCRYFPEGEYDVYPVFKVGDGDWLPMMHNLSLTSAKLHFVNDGYTITVSQEPDTEAPSGSIISCELTGIMPLDRGETRFYPCHSYGLYFDLQADGACFNELRPVFYDSDMHPVAIGTRSLVNITDTGVYSRNFWISLPDSVKPGDYLLYLAASVDGELLPLGEATAVSVEAESITLDYPVLSLLIGESFELHAAAHTDLEPVFWSSSDELVAKVDDNGTVTAVGLGEADIIARCCCVEDTCRLTVLPVMASSVLISPSSISLEVGTSAQLEASVMPENTTDKTVVWSVSDPSLVQVDAEGVVTAIAEGSAEVTATCGEASAVCSISAFSGIEAVNADFVTVDADGSAVVVSAPAASKVCVYALDGKLLYSGLQHRIELAPGSVYMVVVDGSMFRVVIR